MRRPLALSAWLLLVTTLAVPSAEAAVALATQGHALLPVVVSPTASASTQANAAELAQLLGAMIGGTVSVTTGDGSAGIVVGTLADFPDPHLAAGLTIQGADGREAFAIRTDTGRVRLIAATDLGVASAVARLLRELGYRHFFPAPEWEVVPSLPNASIDLSVTERPAVLSRAIPYGFGFFYDDIGLDPRELADFAAWSRHNRMGASLQIDTGHAWQDVILANVTAFQAHPEYLAEFNGVRETFDLANVEALNLCMSNPAVQQMATTWAVSQFQLNPTRDMISVGPSDGPAGCQSDACEALGSTSDRVFTLVNQMADAVAAAYPSKYVGVLAYADYTNPPDFPLASNVFVQLTHGFDDSSLSFPQLLEAWPKITPLFGVYEYGAFWGWNPDMPAVDLAANTAALAQTIRADVAHHAMAVTFESSSNWGPDGLGYYLISQLLWDPTVDVAAVRADFLQKAFGSAAAAMDDFYARFDGANAPLPSSQNIGLACQDLVAATAEAHGDPAVLARLEDLKIYLVYVWRRWQFDHTTDEPTREALAFSILTDAWRARYTYMDHLMAIATSFAYACAQEFNQPSWDPPHVEDPTPWKVDGDIPSDEIDAGFAQAVAYFPTSPAPVFTPFSRDLVPVVVPGTAIIPSWYQYARPLTYAFFSRSGEDLVFQYCSGSPLGKIASYTITGMDGTVIATGSVPGDQQFHPIDVPVPAAGQYRFTQDATDGWSIKVDPGVSCSAVLDQMADPYHEGGMWDLYCYVPKGTTELTLFYYNMYTGATCRLYDPLGDVFTIASDQDIQSIPVPPGADGGYWWFGDPSSLNIGYFALFTIPNVVAESPQALLIPREVAVADGLTIATDAPPLPVTPPQGSSSTTGTGTAQGGVLTLEGSGGSGHCGLGSIGCLILACHALRRWRRRGWHHEGGAPAPGGLPVSGVAPAGATTSPPPADSSATEG